MVSAANQNAATPGARLWPGKPNKNFALDFYFEVHDFDQNGAMAASMALLRSLQSLNQTMDFDDDVTEFFGMLFPAIIHAAVHRQNSRKRKRKQDRKLKKVDGRIGRRWKQRKKGEFKKEDLAWWRLSSSCSSCTTSS